MKIKQFINKLSIALLCALSYAALSFSAYGSTNLPSIKFLPQMKLGEASCGQFSTSPTAQSNCLCSDPVPASMNSTNYYVCTSNKACSSMSNIAVSCTPLDHN